MYLVPSITCSPVCYIEFGCESVYEYYTPGCYVHSQYIFLVYMKFSIISKQTELHIIGGLMHTHLRI